MLRRIRSLGRFQPSNSADSFHENFPSFMRAETEGCEIISAATCQRRSYSCLELWCSTNLARVTLHSTVVGPFHRRLQEDVTAWAIAVHFCAASEQISRKTMKSIGAFSIAPAQQDGKAGILDTVAPERGSRRSLSIAPRSGRRNRLPPTQPFRTINCRRFGVANSLYPVQSTASGRRWRNLLV
jgi:hypothetical protein